MVLFAILALLAGGAIALQASMNSQLGTLLNNSWLATSIAFLISLLFTLPVVVASIQQMPTVIEIKAVPWYLWLGGVLSAFGVGMFYFLIPQMGVGTMMSFALSGQIVIAVITSHYGWFNLPITPISLVKGTGVVLLIFSVILINWGAENGS